MAVRGHINRHDSRKDDDMSRLLEIVKKLVKEGADLNTQTKVIISMMLYTYTHDPAHIGIDRMGRLHLCMLRWIIGMMKLKYWLRQVLILTLKTK